jgi:hypothetical protein
MEGPGIFVMNREIPENFLSEGKTIAIDEFDSLI